MQQRRLGGQPIRWFVWKWLHKVKSRSTQRLTAIRKPQISFRRFDQMRPNSRLQASKKAIKCRAIDAILRLDLRVAVVGAVVE